MIYTLVLALEIFHTTVSINSTEYYSAQAEPIKCDCCSLRVLLREFDCHLTRQSKIIVSITKKGALVCCFFGRGRLSDKVYGSDMFTVSRSRRLVLTLRSYSGSSCHSTVYRSTVQLQG